MEGSVIYKETEQIINEYMQVYKDLRAIDLGVLKQIEKKLEEIFKHCYKNQFGFYVVMDFDFDLRFIISKDKSKYIRLEGGDVNSFFTWNYIADIGCEKNFLKELEIILERIKAINGLNSYIDNTHNNKQAIKSDTNDFF